MVTAAGASNNDSGTNSSSYVLVCIPWESVSSGTRSDAEMCVDRRLKKNLFCLISPGAAVGVVVMPRIRITGCLG